MGIISLKNLLILHEGHEGYFSARFFSNGISYEFGLSFIDAFDLGSFLKFGLNLVGKLADTVRGELNF